MFYQPMLYTCKTLQNPLMQRANVRVWLEVYGCLRICTQPHAHIEKLAISIRACLLREYTPTRMLRPLPCVLSRLQATQKIRELPGPNQNTPIIAVTANAMKGDRDKCLQAGMNDYISKPVERKRMLLAIKKWTEQRSKHATEAKTKQEQQHHETGQ